MPFLLGCRITTFNVTSLHSWNPKDFIRCHDGIIEQQRLYLMPETEDFIKLHHTSSPPPKKEKKEEKTSQTIVPNMKNYLSCMSTFCRSIGTGMSCPSRKPMHLHIHLLRRLIKWMSKFTFFQPQKVLFVTVVTDLKIRLCL